MIQPLRTTDSSEISKIHIEALSKDFLPSLGENFLTAFYEGVLDKSQVFGFVDKERGKVNGFVVGTTDMNRFMKLALLSNFIKLSFFLFVEIIKKPIILKNIFETLTYSSKESGPKAELVVICVGKNSKRKGAGRKLVNSLEREMKRRKIKEYKLTVTKRNKSANKFYEKLGFTKFSSFTLYNKSWNLLVKKV